MTDSLQQKQAALRARIARVALGDSTVTSGALRERFGCDSSTIARALAEVGLRADMRGNISRATVQDIERRNPGNERDTRAELRQRIVAAKAADPELTGTQLAARFGLSRASVSRILRGES